MGQVKRAAAIVEELRACSEKLNDLANELNELFFGSTDERGNAPAPQPTPKPEPEKPALKLEDVRKVLAQKARAGLTDEVRALIQKYGAERLSDVEPIHYAALLADAEVLHAE
ncbi:hypothetical protein [Murdochiella vaginalis]|uniref:hypothetical protein n=1 Tax=Murdochiella vaginalis TaxID=1852373 RepID=UPI0008FE586E|nr:hypothetical protein [Murdochiella vaginalis]